jgi:hypothetical protein
MRTGISSGSQQYFDQPCRCEDVDSPGCHIQGERENEAFQYREPKSHDY